MNNIPSQVKIFEVGPRDGLQNEPNFVPTPLKIAFINQLSQSGLKNIEATSFVSNKAIPQLADSETVFKAIEKNDAVHFWALVPNEKGMLKAIQAGAKHVAVFTAASEQFNQHNINCSIDESLDRIIPIAALAKEHQISLRGYISCVLGCPYEGSIHPKQVMRVAKRLLSLGIQDLSLGDTIGVGTPQQTNALLQTLLTELSVSQLAMHFHDTYGQAIANIYASLTLGINQFDSSVAGLGGCPYARGATGNVATEDILYLLHGLGVETGIDIYKIVAAGDLICKAMGRKNQSKVANALLANG